MCAYKTRAHDISRLFRVIRARNKIIINQNEKEKFKQINFEKLQLHKTKYYKINIIIKIIIT